VDTFLCECREGHERNRRENQRSADPRLRIETWGTQV
jgi:hypothetical protein